MNVYLEGVNIPIIDYPEVISMADNPARAIMQQQFLLQ